MSISNIGTNLGSSQIGALGGRSTVRQARQDFEQLFQSMQAGNLSGAQQAYSDLQQLRTASQGTAAADSSSTASPVVTDWSALGQALQSGSMSTAQDALSKLKQDAATQWQSEIQNAQATYALMQGSATPNASTTSTSAVSAVGNNIQTDLDNLNQSLQSGDTAGAQKLLAKLEQDLQTSGQSGQFPRHHHHHGGFASQSVASSYAANAANATTAASTSTAGAGSTSSGGVGTASTA